MFAGPNGSGKSTIKSVVPPELLGVYLNPAEIEKEIRDRDFLDLRAYGVEMTREEILPFFANSTLLANAGLDDEAKGLRFSDGKLSFFEVIVNGYFASVAADFIRQKLLEKRVSFSFNVDRGPMSIEDLSLGAATCPLVPRPNSPTVRSTNPNGRRSDSGSRAQLREGIWQPSDTRSEKSSQNKSAARIILFKRFRELN